MTLHKLREFQECRLCVCTSGLAYMILIRRIGNGGQDADDGDDDHYLDQGKTCARFASESSCIAHQFVLTSRHEWRPKRCDPATGMHCGVAPLEPAKHNHLSSGVTPLTTPSSVSEMPDHGTFSSSPISAVSLSSSSPSPLVSK